MCKMKTGKDDWLFKINGKTGELEIRIPKRRSYSPEEMARIAVGLMRMCSSVGGIWDEMLKEETATKVVKK